MALKNPSLINKFITEVKLNDLDYSIYKLKNFEPVATNLSSQLDNKTKRKILNYISNNKGKDPILLFSHDLSRLGAQIILLNIARNLFNKHNRSIILITLKGGELYKDFTDFCAVINLEQNNIKNNTKDCVTLKNFKEDSYLEELIKIKKLILSNYYIPSDNIQRGIDLIIRDFDFDKNIVYQSCQTFFQYNSNEKQEHI